MKINIETNYIKYQGDELYMERKRKRIAQENVDLCKGCRLCVENCPKKAIIPLEEVNKKGYKIIRVDKDKCIGCGICYKICPDYVYTIE